jgi:hypothetical protein
MRPELEAFHLSQSSTEVKSYEVIPLPPICFMACLIEYKDNKVEIKELPLGAPCNPVDVHRLDPVDGDAVAAETSLNSWTTCRLISDTVLSTVAVVGVSNPTQRIQRVVFSARGSGRPAELDHPFSALCRFLKYIFITDSL